jgi:cytochrome c oxidase subunit 1
MFVVGLEMDSKAYFMTGTMLISLPTGSKVFSWLCTYVSVFVIYDMLGVTLCIMYVKLFVILFVLGGSSGIILGNNVIDVSLHDSYYVVSHFHVVLSMGSILSIKVVVISNQEYVIGCIIKSISCRIVYYLMCLFIMGIFVTFVPLHYMCFSSVPRRMLDFQDSINGWSCISSSGVSVT